MPEYPPCPSCGRKLPRNKNIAVCDECADEQARQWLVKHKDNARSANRTHVARKLYYAMTSGIIEPEDFH